MDFLSTLTYFDIIIAVIVLLLGMKGFIQGFIKEFFGLLGLVLGVYLASHFAQNAATFIDQNIFKHENIALLKLIGFMAILSIVWVGVTTVGSAIATLKGSEGQHIVGRILGFIAGTARYFLIFALIVTALSNVSLVKDNLEKHLDDSTLYPSLKKVGSFLINLELEKPLEVESNITGLIRSEVNATEQNVTQ